MQTTPPCSPQNALMDAAELMYVTGMTALSRCRQLSSFPPVLPLPPNLLKIAPAHLELLGLGHVGHRAAGGQVRQNHLLMIGAQHVGAFGHEVHAAEHDELGVGMRRHLLRELVRVAGVVGELDHFVALIVMAEDHEPAAERAFAAAMRASISSSDRPRYRSGSGWRSAMCSFSYSVRTAATWTSLTSISSRGENGLDRLN